MFAPANPLLKDILVDVQNDRVRGVLVVIDEAADVTEYTWNVVIKPMLLERHGEAFVVGTPRGKNHWLHRIYQMGKKPELSTIYSSIQLPTKANPATPKGSSQAAVTGIGFHRSGRFVLVILTGEIVSFEATELAPGVTVAGENEQVKFFGRPLQGDDTWQERYINGPDEKSPELRFWLAAASGGEGRKRSEGDGGGSADRRAPDCRPRRWSSGRAA